MGIVNGTETIIIISVVMGAIMLGSKKIPELARSFGRASTEYERAKVEAKRELDLVRNNPNRQKLEADTLGIDHSNKNDV